jgi:hypothetical protein
MSPPTTSNIFQSPSTVKKVKKKKDDAPSLAMVNASLQRPSTRRSISPVLPSQAATATLPPSQVATAVQVPVEVANTLPPTSLPSVPNEEHTPAAAETLHSLSRISFHNDLPHTSSINMNLLDKDDNLLIDAFGIEDLATEDDGQSPGTNSVTNGPLDWNNVSPNQVMARLKLLKVEVLEQHDLCPFYKSYTTWEKMTREQQNKAVAWF